ncbi:MAG: hypothetical protein QMC83_02740 [Thermodesulfovibrionales bacterium]|nr:hypothetical protein [Thermodesulfovibrionales bacterium]
MSVIEERVDRLEKVLSEFITSVGIEFNKVYNSQMRTDAELRLFKDEMKAFKDEMKQINREMNIKWGEMANKLGTIVEDLVAPSIPGIVNEEFGLEVTDLMVRRKKRLEDGRVREKTHRHTGRPLYR